MVLFLLIIFYMKKKKNIKYTLLITLICFTFACMQNLGGKASAEALLSSERTPTAQVLAAKVLRLHIIANSDSEADQLIKLKIRDEITEKYSDEFSLAQTKEEAQNSMSSKSDEIEEFVNGILVQNGFEYSCEIIIGQDEFPDRTYGKLVFPAGEYSAVKVILGKGDGENWWCVLYPPLCFLNAGSDEESKKYAQENEGRIQVRSRLAEWVKALKLPH